MEHAKGQVSKSAAEIYEEFFVPALFAEWAPRVADATAIEPGQSVLDVACGTGLLARELARRKGKVVGLDCNDLMLAVARQKAPDIDFQKGRAEELPFTADSFDAVTCQFGLMFFDDQKRALSEMWRVLKPGGTLAVAVWASLDDTPGYAAVVELLSRLFGDGIANELRAPFSLGDPSAVRGLFDGIAEPRIETTVGLARFPSIEAWVHTDIRGWTLADTIDDEQYALFLREARAHLRNFAPVEEVTFDSPAHVISARKAFRSGRNQSGV